MPQNESFQAKVSKWKFLSTNAKATGPKQKFYKESSQTKDPEGNLSGKSSRAKDNKRIPIETFEADDLKRKFPSEKYQAKVSAPGERSQKIASERSSSKD